MKYRLSADRHFYRFGAWLVLAFAVAYYAQYYRSGLNLGGEAGTDAVVAMRLLAGERPIADTFLGYNVMWFYPVAWLFKFTGPDYVALRVYFFAICTLTGLMAFFVIRRSSGSGIWAVAGAVLPVLAPGMISRNYMAFLAVLNMVTFLHAWVLKPVNPTRRMLWVAASGFSLALTWLVRIDLGMFFTVILAGLIVVYPLGKGDPGRIRTALAGVALAAVFFAGLHAPFYFDAVRRDYVKPFTGQYKMWAPFLAYLAKTEWSALQAHPAAAPPPPPVATVAPAQVQPAVPQVAQPPVPVSPAPQTVKKDIDAGSYEARPPLSALWNPKNWKLRFFATALYLPLLVALPAVLVSAIALLVAVFFRPDAGLRGSALSVLVTTGAALTLFPQYFFFRPDIPHLADFMAAFLPAMFVAVWVAFREAWRRGWGAIVCAVIFAALCAWDTGTYLATAMPHETAGTIAAARGRNAEFAGGGGAHVLLRQDERDELQALYREITGASKPGEYVVCYPYGAMISLLTDRPSYEYNLYVDNASDVADFNRDAIDRIHKYSPAVIVIDNININGTEDSRFKNWAAPVYDYIRGHFDYRGTWQRQEVYVRRANPQTNQP